VQADPSIGELSVKHESLDLKDQAHGPYYEESRNTITSPTSGPRAIDENVSFSIDKSSN